jgi:hypothetical protein
MFFITSATAHAFAYRRWSSSLQKASMWPLFGRFSGCACVASLCGAIAYAFRMKQLTLLIVTKKLEHNSTSAADHVLRHQSGLSSGDRYGDYFAGAFVASYPFELAYVIAAILLMLQRVRRILVGNTLALRAQSVTTRLFLLAVFAGLVIGTLSNIAATVYYALSASARVAAGAAWSSNNTELGEKQDSAAHRNVTLALTISSVQRYMEAAVLMLMIVAFVVIGYKSSRVISNALRALSLTQQRLLGIPATSRRSAAPEQALLVQQASGQGRRLRRKIVITFIFVFFSLLARSFFSILYAFALAFEQESCDDRLQCGQCGPCKNTYALILRWILYTPELQLLIMIFASPLALLVALWGMTDVAEIERMPSAHEQLKGARMIANNRSSVNNSG